MSIYSDIVIIREKYGFEKANNISAQTHATLKRILLLSKIEIWILNGK